MGAGEYYLLDPKSLKAADGQDRFIESQRPVLELCAGNGKLAYWMRKFGIRVLAIDNYSWKPMKHPHFVEKIEYKDALAKYNPNIVISCYPTEANDLPQDVLRHPSVNYFIHLGNAERDLIWRNELEKIRGIERMESLVDTIDTRPTFEDGVISASHQNMIYR